MSSILWIINAFLVGLLLVTFVPVILYFNPICGIVFGFLFLRIFVLCINVIRDERAAQQWCDDAANSPILNNDPQNIVDLPAHPLHNQYLGK